MTFLDHFILSFVSIQDTLAVKKIAITFSSVKLYLARILEISLGELCPVGFVHLRGKGLRGDTQRICKRRIGIIVKNHFASK